MEIPDGFAPYEPQGPFLEHIGPVLVRDDDGGPVFGLLVEERLTNHRGTIQGGMLSTFADFALGRAIEADADDGKERATVSLTVDFLKPAKPGDWIETRTRGARRRHARVRRLLAHGLRARGRPRAGGLGRRRLRSARPGAPVRPPSPGGP